MREAKVADYWRGVSKKKYPLFISKVSGEGVLGGISPVQFGGGINAFCGRNGSGKSTLLNLIDSSLGGDLGAILTRYENGRFSIEIETGGNIESRDIRLDETERAGDSIGLDYKFVSVVQEVPQMVEAISSVKDLLGLLSAYDPFELESEQLDAISYLVGAVYDSVQTFEVEDGIGRSGNTIPYFRVRKNGVTYGSEHMGLGEYSLFFLYWFFDRLVGESIILIEEPESFITPESQVRISNYFAMQSLSKGVSILLTTHSEHILKNIPNECIHVVDNTPGCASVVKGNEAALYLDSLGLTRRKRGLLLVEDQAARLFLECLFSTSHLPFFKEFEIVDCDGEGNVQRSLDVLPGGIGTLIFIGVFDGDVEGKVDLSKLNQTHVVLPGDDCPENVFKGLMYPVLKERFVGLKGEVFEASLLAQIATVDKHEWVRAYASGVGMTYEQLFSRLFERWYLTDGNEEVSEAFLTELANISGMVSDH